MVEEKELVEQLAGLETQRAALVNEICQKLGKDELNYSQLRMLGKEDRERLLKLDQQMVGPAAQLVKVVKEKEAADNESQFYDHSEDRSNELSSQLSSLEGEVSALQKRPVVLSDEKKVEEQLVSIEKQCAALENEISRKLGKARLSRDELSRLGKDDRGRLVKLEQQLVEQATHLHDIVLIKESKGGGSFFFEHSERLNRLSDFISRISDEIERLTAPDKQAQQPAGKMGKAEPVEKAERRIERIF